MEDKNRNNPQANGIGRRYLRYLKLERGYSANTIEAYRHDLDWLLDYLRERQLDPLTVRLSFSPAHFMSTG